MSLTNIRLHKRRRRCYRSPAEYFYGRHRRRAGRAARGGQNAAQLPSAEAIIHADNLIGVLEDLRRNGGQAPGLDRLTYQQLGKSEGAATMRFLSQVLREACYRPHPARPVPIPKTGGGFRTLRVSNICDRVVATALDRALSPYWERIYLDNSFGFRPGRNVWTLLARLEVDVRARNRLVLVHDDVRKAFDNLSINLLMEDHRRHISEPALLALVEVILRGNEGPDRTVGIDQGGAYSPNALNLHLHNRLDLVLERDHRFPFWRRYVDNVVLMCQSVPEGRQVWGQAKQCLQAVGLAFKGEANPEESIVDLRRGSVSLLGYTIRYREGHLRYDLHQESLTRLTQNLTEAHKTPDPPSSAKAVILGWLEWQGPVFENWQESNLLHQVQSIALAQGFREIPSQEHLRGQWKSSYRRWQACRQAAWKQHRSA